MSESLSLASPRHLWHVPACVIGILTLVYGPARASAEPPTAAAFYKERCAGCHGADGRNPRLHTIFPDLPDFTNRAWQAAHTKVQLKDVILHGKGAMPAYRGDLDGVTVGQLIDYLRKFAPPGPSAKAKPGSDPKAVPAVAQLFEERCAGCHGAKGSNPGLHKLFPSLPDFTSGAWQAAHTKAEMKKVILHGKGAMPAYKGDLDGISVGQLIDFLRQFAQSGRSR
jgi:mono/diheme cytochrome c family protein